jgi:hypothetical protein
MAVSAVTSIYACKLTKTSRVYIGNTFPKTVDQVVSGSIKESSEPRLLCGLILCTAPSSPPLSRNL